MWRRLHEAVDAACLQGAMQISDADSVMVSSVINCYLPGPIVKLESELTSMTYIDLVGLYPFICIMFPISDDLFQENATPPHHV